MPAKRKEEGRKEGGGGQDGRRGDLTEGENTCLSYNRN